MSTMPRLRCGARRGGHRRRATRAACWPSSRRTRRARASAPCSTATEAALSAAGVLLRLAPGAVVHAERDQIFLAAVGLLLFHPVHLAPLVEARFVRPDPPGHREIGRA